MRTSVAESPRRRTSAVSGTYPLSGVEFTLSPSSVTGNPMEAVARTGAVMWPTGSPADSIVAGEFSGLMMTIAVSAPVSSRSIVHTWSTQNFVQGDEFSSVARSKGLVWLASRNNAGGDWSQSGNVFSLSLAGEWAAASPTGDWPDDPQFQEHVQEVWLDPWGDRRQELVLIGQHLQRERIEHLLEECLLADDELAAGPEIWKGFEDPFYNWSDDD